LQKIRRDLEVQSWPDCGGRAQVLLMESMDWTIRGYLAFMRQDPHTDGINAVRNTMRQFQAELERITH
jgi:hypothetical protein